MCLLIDRLNHFDIKPGFHAIMSLEEDKHPSNQLTETQERSDIVLVYWPSSDAFVRVRRSNNTSVFLRAMHELCDTVCIPVTKEDVCFLSPFQLTFE